ncbi:MAG TPA: beta-propeller domain-containing protein [Myxococcota bacterium]|nr:beta-propeller domain-containing protein [Myxococcota bacterium]
MSLLPLLALANADSTTLEPFRSCEAYDDALVEAITDQLAYQDYYYGYYGMLGGVATMARESAAPSVSGSAGAGPSSHTTTNVQEQGVDELDFVKTDGKFIYSLNGQELAIVQSWPVDSVEKIGSLTIEGQLSSLFLDGDRVVVISRLYDNGGWGYGAGTRATVVDVSDRTRPRVIRTLDMEGSMTQGRLIGGKAYFVLNDSAQVPQDIWNLVYAGELELPLVDWSSEQSRQDSVQARKDILRPAIAKRLATLDRSERLPAYTDSLPGWMPKTGTLVDCEDIHSDGSSRQPGLLSVVKVDLRDMTKAPEGSAVVGSGWNVYASTDSLYVAQNSGSWWWWGWGWGGGTWDPGTDLHKFDLRGDKPAYRASGHVDGWLLNQFAMSEHEGNLRVAATDDDWWWGSGNTGAGSSVTVLRDNGYGDLVVTGRVEGIAPGEQIYGVRFDGDRGYLVTFRQVDPLHVIDLSDPSEPTVRGELQIPGYSSYLHPIEGGYLLAVGMDGDWNGRLNGLKVSIFDVRDMDRPREVQKYTVTGDDWSWSEALYDHHAFTYADGVLSIPTYTYDQTDWTYEAGLLVLDADPRKGISERGQVSHSDLAAPGSWVAVRRSIYIDDVLVSISNAGMKFSSLAKPGHQLASLKLEEGVNSYYW